MLIVVSQSSVHTHTSKCIPIAGPGEVFQPPYHDRTNALVVKCFACTLPGGLDISSWG